MKALWHVAIWRYSFVVLQAIALVYILWHIVKRTASEPIAASDLAANHQLVSGDIRTLATDDLIGRYLRAPVEAGKPITPAMVSKDPPAPKLTNSVSAIVTLSSAMAKQRGIREGSAVIIKRAEPHLEVTGEVITRICDDSMCAFLIGVSKLQASAIISNGLNGADLVLDATSREH